jgi:hypothetical protein
LKLSNSCGPVFTLNPTHYPLQNGRCNRINPPICLNLTIEAAGSFIPDQNSSWLMVKAMPLIVWALPAIVSCNTELDWYLHTQSP